MKAVILVFVIAIIAMLPVCLTSVGLTGWSNMMAYRVMESVPDNSNEARVIKADISAWLDNHPKKTYEEAYSGGCSSTWQKLFRLQFCEWDLSDWVNDGEGDGSAYCAETGCPAASRDFDCDKFEQNFKLQQAIKLYGSNPTQEQIDAMDDTCNSKDTKWDVDCMGGAMIDCNDNGIPDEGDMVAMTTCHRDADYAMGGDSGCDCAYDLKHTGYDYVCLNPDTGEYDPSMGHLVFTPMSGVVVSSGYASGGWGWEVAVYNCGTLTVFNHLDIEQMNPEDDNYNAPIKVGDYVQAAQAVGRLGGGYRTTNDEGMNVNDFSKNGNSTGTHLDFRSMECITNDTGHFTYEINNFSRDTNIATTGLINDKWENQKNTSGGTCRDWYVSMGGDNGGGVLHNHSCGSRASRK